ncbi:MAG TPA: hypothetical protein VNC78_11765 [Actinomycetota bacterium]|nr:hypothetical protein [Actinomycetota bacterium]
MGLRERAYKITDRPMTWARAVLLGTVIIVIATLLLGQAPSWIIYWFDQEVAAIIDFTKKIPGVDKEMGLNTTQIKIIRDIVANAVQNTFLIMMLVAAYFWQKSKQKRTGSKTLQDPVKGYMPGK